MSDIEPNLREKSRQIEALKAEISELKNAVIALLKGMKEAEDSTGDDLMPIGKYYEIEFK